MPDYIGLPVLLELERALVRHGWYTHTQRSNITRGWTYNANIIKLIPTGRFHKDEPKTEIMQTMPYGAGSGYDPLLAVIDAAHLTRCREPDVLAAILEAEVWLLDRAVKRARAREAALADLDWTLIDLTDTLAMVNVEPFENTAALAAENDEDDDL